MNHPSSELLALHAGHDLPEREAQSVDEHLAVCELCRGEVSEIASSMAAFRGMAAAAPAASGIQSLGEALLRRTSRSRMGLYRMAAAAAVLVSASAGVLWLGHREAPVQAPAQTQTTADNSRVAAPEVRRAGETKRITGSQSPQAVSVRPKTLPAGIRSVALEPQEDGRAVLRIATADPNVVILWQLSDDIENKEGSSEE